MGIFGSDKDAETTDTRTTDRGPMGSVKNEPTTLSRGETHRFTKPSKDKAEVTVTSQSKGSDAKFALTALVLYRDGQQVFVGKDEDADMAETQDRSVRHHGERMMGLSDDEKLTLKWDQGIESVAIAARAWDDSNQSGSQARSQSQPQFGNLLMRFAGEDETVELVPQAANAQSDTLYVGRVDYNNDGSMSLKNQEQFAAPNSQSRMSFVDHEIRLSSDPQGQMR